jgi:hypothetical protein
MQRFISLALILAASTAHADDDDLKRKWQGKFYDLTGDVERVRSRQMYGLSFDKCRDMVKVAAEEGVLPDMKMVRWDGKVLRFSEVGKLCDDYERAFHVAQVTPLFVQAQRDLDMLTKHLDLSQTDPKHQAAFKQSAKECFAAADQVDKLGIGAETVRVYSGDALEIRFDEARAKICEPIAKAAGSFAADVKKATDERVAELAAPYKAVGIKGDKLQFCIENANHPIYGVGGGSLEPAQIKKAHVVFTLWQDSSSGVYSLWRHVFKGDKLVSDTEKKFPRFPAPRAFR